MAIISSARNAGQKLNLSNLRVDIEDTSFLSEYFVLSEYNPKFTAGKNTFLLNGSDKLAPNSAIQIEAVDVNGNSLYVEIGKTNSIIYKEGGAIRVAVYIYSDTPYGVGRIIIVSREKTDNKVVRWIGNIQINPNVQNSSKVIFYKAPTLSVTSTYVPITTDESSGYSQVADLTPVTTYAVIPKKDDDYGLFDINSSPVDYRLTFSDPTFVVSSSMKNALVDIYVTKFDEDVNINTTSSNVIVDVIDERTVKLKNPIYYTNSQNKKIVANAVDAKLSATFTGVKYDSRFLKTSSVNQSVALVKYTNLKTYSGNIYRHRLYRRSLSAAGDFEVIADEPIIDCQTLIDFTTPNSYFKSLGSFPNKEHLHHYWHSSSAVIKFNRNASYLMDAMEITSSTLDEHYIIVKNDTNAGSANHVYVPYDYAENIVESGTAYDSNFMTFYPDVIYKLSVKSKILKSDSSKPSNIAFYITSSMVYEIDRDSSYDVNRGIKLGEIYLDETSSSLYHPEPIVFYSKFSKQFYGTMVIYINNCIASLADIQFSTYSEPSFSPEIFVSRIPFPVNTAGEQFEIKSELFDVNSNLVYSDLRTITTFDETGATLYKTIPGLTSADITNGLSTFNLVITTAQTSPKQGLYMLNAARFEFDVSGSGTHTANDATFHIKKGTVSISPQITDSVGGAVYIKPSTLLEINPTTLGTLDNIDIGQTTSKKGKFTDLVATTSATVPTTTAPGTVSATVTSTTLASTPGTVDVICPLKTPDGWLLINGKKVPYYN